MQKFGKLKIPVKTPKVCFYRFCSFKKWEKTSEKVTQQQTALSKKKKSMLICFSNQYFQLYNCHSEQLSWIIDTILVSLPVYFQYIFPLVAFVKKLLCKHHYQRRFWMTLVCVWIHPYLTVKWHLLAIGRKKTTTLEFELQEKT